MFQTCHCIRESLKPCTCKVMVHCQEKKTWPQGTEAWLSDKQCDVMGVIKWLHRQEMQGTQRRSSQVHKKTKQYVVGKH